MNNLLYKDFENQPFFVVGSDRSGTTMFRLMLNCHSRIRMPRESWFLIPLMDELPLNEQLTPEQVGLAFEIVVTHTRWDDWEIENELLKQKLDELENPRLSDVVDTIFTLASEGKPRWGDKTPPYVFEIERLHKVFPGAKFIHVIRDVRDVCLSLYGRNWHGIETWDLTNYWVKCVSTGHETGKMLSEEQYLELHYEDLVLDTEGSLRKVCDWLGEDFEQGMLDFHEHAENQVASWEKELHNKVMRRPKSSDVHRWRKEMTFLQVARVESIAGRVMDTVGQPRRFPGHLKVIPILVRFMFYIADITLPIRSRLGIHFPNLRKRF
jgi:hypothetical protein